MYCEANNLKRLQKIPKKNRNGKLTHYEITSDSGNQTRVGASNSFGYISIPCEGSRVISVRGCNRQGCSTEASITIPSYESKHSLTTCISPYELIDHCSSSPYLHLS